MLFNVLMYALMIYLIFRMFSMNKGVNKRRRVIGVIQQIENKDEFFAAADEMINTCGDPEIEMKTKIIKLWGMAYHNDYAGFEELLDQIDVEPLFTVKNGKRSIQENEDSFFYFLLALPNMLYGNDRNDLRKLVEKKIHQFDDKLSDQLNLKVAEHCTLFYDKEGDLGEEFFRNVSAGEFPSYKYSKQLIGIYKNICDTMICKIRQDRGEDFSEYEEYVRGFNNSGVGARWIKMTGLNLPAVQDETADEVPETEETEEENKEDNE